MKTLIVGLHDRQSGPTLLRTPFEDTKDMRFKIAEAVKPLDCVEHIYVSEDILWLTPTLVQFTEEDIAQIEGIIQEVANQ